MSVRGVLCGAGDGERASSDDVSSAVDGMSFGDGGGVRGADIVDRASFGDGVSDLGGVSGAGGGGDGGGVCSGAATDLTRSSTGGRARA